MPRNDTEDRSRAGGALSGRAVEVAEADAGATEVWFTQAAGLVDGTRDAILQGAEHLRLLSLRQASRRHGVVELVLGGGDQCADQPVDGLAVRLRNLGKALATFELGA